MLLPAENTLQGDCFVAPLLAMTMKGNDNEGQWQSLAVIASEAKQSP